MSAIKIHVHTFTSADIEAGLGVSDVKPIVVDVLVPDGTAVAVVKQPKRPETLDYELPWTTAYEIADDRARGLDEVSINGVRYKAVK